MFLDLWITSEVGNLVLIYMRSFFKDSYFATATAVIINVHFSITCLLLSYSSPSTTLCIITVTHCKSGGGLECVCVCVSVSHAVRMWICEHSVSLTNLCVSFMCVYAKYSCVFFVCLQVRAFVRLCANAVWAGFRVGVLSSVHQKLKPVRLPYLQMEPPDVIAATPPPSSCDLTQLDCP